MLYKMIQSKFFLPFLETKKDRFQVLKTCFIYCPLIPIKRHICTIKYPEDKILISHSNYVKYLLMSSSSMWYRDLLIHLAFTQCKAILFMWISHHYNNIKIIININWIFLIWLALYEELCIDCVFWCLPQHFKLGVIIPLFINEKRKILQRLKSLCRAH